MTKSYFNHGITGNSRILASISQTGELLRLFWPNIDYPQHIEKFAVGIYEGNKGGGTCWLDSCSWRIEQRYVADTNILETVYFDDTRGLKTVQSDYCVPEKDLMIRQYELENNGAEVLELGFTLYSSVISTNPQLAGTLVDSAANSLIHYRNHYYLSLSSDRETSGFQLGNNAFGSASQASLAGFDTVGMMQEGALLWEPAELRPGSRMKFTLYLCLAHTLKEVKRLAKEAVLLDPAEEYRRTVRYWKNFIQAARPMNTGRAEIDELYRRTLLVFKLMSDEKTGGLLAAPELDEGFTRCGRYAYCWGRDAAFITGAMDRCGLTRPVEQFYHWAVQVQDEEGSWQQRYHMDGNLAPSWGLQIDETGTIIWGILQHYDATGNKGFLKDMWESVEKAADFLVGFLDPETGLPAPSYDLWEERLGEHAYSAAAVYGGLYAAAGIAGLLGREGAKADSWRAVAGRIKNSIVEYFWKPDWKRFLRSIRVKTNPWGEENTEDRVFLKLNPKGLTRDFTREDWIVDICLLGLNIPFHVFDADDPMMEGTAAVVEQVLASPVSGGILRYEYDTYAGGNPWIISTLWLALHYLEKKEYGKAQEYFEWVVKSRTELGLLPEQIGRETGKPAWVIPLTWSHAMFVLVLDGLIEAGVLKE